MEVAGAYAMYDGPRSPCTQTFGLGLFRMPIPGDMDELESYFRQRGAPVFHEVSPLAHKALLPVLNQRGYKPVELSNVMVMALAGRDSGSSTVNQNLSARIASASERETWARTASEGWREFGEVADLMLDLMRVSVEPEDDRHR